MKHQCTLKGIIKIHVTGRGQFMAIFLVCHTFLLQNRLGGGGGGGPLFTLNDASLAHVISRASGPAKTLIVTVQASKRNRPRLEDSGQGGKIHQW